MSESWDDLADWWQGDIADDAAYRNDVHPLLDRLMSVEPGVIVDLGCGEGQGMRRLPKEAFGIDLSHELLRRSGLADRTFVARAPDLRALRTGVVDTMYSVYLLDLLADVLGFFEEAARVVAPDGVLIVVINHPAYTAPGSAPLMDEDGEVLWRWGAYFIAGSSEEPAGERTVTFHHRPIGDILTAAAAAGWVLEELVERPLSPDTVDAIPGYTGQEHIPRLAGFRWRRAGRAIQ